MYIPLSLCLFLAVVAPAPWKITVVLLWVAAALGLAWHILDGYRRLRAHGEALRSFANTQGWQVGDVIIGPSRRMGYTGSLGRFYLSDALSILGETQQNDWSYREVACKVKTVAGGGPPKRVAVMYYAIVVMDLPGNVLPDVFLTAQPAKARHQRIHFHKSKQIITLGELGRYFKIYSQDHIEQDYSLLLEPEIARVFIACADYDIEIKANRLYVYDKLREPGQQIPDMLSKAMSIKSVLERK
jgi:hypothetical protein